MFCFPENNSQHRERGVERGQSRGEDREEEGGAGPQPEEVDDPQEGPSGLHGRVRKAGGGVEEVVRGVHHQIQMHVRIFLCFRFFHSTYK